MSVNAIDVLNTIRANSSNIYQDRVPIATQQNLANVGTAILSYDVTKNEFVEALVNRIGLVIIKNRSWRNPLRRFKKGQMPYGKDIEEIFVDIVKAHSYDQEVAETEVFKRELPNVKAIFHRLDRQDFYKTTISDEALSTAFLSERGLGDLIARIVEALYTSDEYDEYILMKQLLVQYGEKDLFYRIHADKVVDESTANKFLVSLRATANTLKFLKPDFNAQGVHNSTKPEDLIIFMTPLTQAYVDVDALARAFNMDKANFIGNVITVDDFGTLENVVAIAVDKDFFMVYDKLFSSRTQYNSQGLYYNIFFHHWELLSTSQFANAILFTTEEVTNPGIPTVTSVTVSPDTANVTAGQTQQFTAQVQGTGDYKQTVAWKIQGQTKADTTINQSGLLTVSATEPAETNIEVIATSTQDTGKFDSAQVTVQGA